MNGADSSTGFAPFSVRMAVRAYEIDMLGHVNQAVYHSYAEHARTRLLTAVGLPIGSVVGLGAAPVLLTGSMRYVRELRADEEFDVTAEMSFGAGKTFHVDSVLSKVDGSVSAEFSGVFGLLDLVERRLVADPRGRLRAASADQAAFDLATGSAR